MARPRKEAMGRPRFIVKVQIPIVTNEPVPMVFVYNRNRSVGGMFPFTAQLRKTLRNELKSFWYAHLIPNKQPRGTFTVSLDNPAPWQEW